MRRQTQSGFSLIELLTVLGMVAILTAIAAPSMRDFIRNNRLTAAGNDLLHSLRFARTEAVKRQGNVVVCATDNPDAADAALTCSDGAFSGWFVFADTNTSWTHDAAEAVMEKHAAVDASVTVRNDNNGIVSYGASGFANPPGGGKVPTANVVICDERGDTAQGANSTARALFITNTGRARVSHTHADVGNALATMGVSCP